MFDARCDSDRIPKIVLFTHPGASCVMSKDPDVSSSSMYDFKNQHVLKRIHILGLPAVSFDANI